MSTCRRLGDVWRLLRFGPFPPLGFARSSFPVARFGVFLTVVLFFGLAVDLGASTSPWETVGEKLCELFYNTLGKALAIVAVVIGGLMYAFGEGGSKSQIAGLAFGAGMVLMAPQFLTWLLPKTAASC